ncbi:unnamed protein product [marine sediment metagenome]|uniref:Uncharacterized protein n=1 Tax=marine sediment metagenome TaxID=412755 RepID=X1MHS1_9ZZZZ
MTGDFVNHTSRVDLLGEPSQLILEVGLIESVNSYPAGTTGEHLARAPAITDGTVMPASGALETPGHIEPNRKLSGIKEPTRLILLVISLDTPAAYSVELNSPTKDQLPDAWIGLTGNVIPIGKIPIPHKVGVLTVHSLAP